MKTYYIYHIPKYVYPKCGSVGKIGVTQQLRRRINDNKIKSIEGFTNWEVLEEHTCKFKVSDREIELQKKYGYKVDNVLYWKMLEIQSKIEKGGFRSLITLQYDKDGNFIKPAIDFGRSWEYWRKIYPGKTDEEITTIKDKPVFFCNGMEIICFFN